MPDLRPISELVGYVASGLVLLTFTTKRMRPLRIVAILSNLAFIGYGILDDIVPVLGLHLILLPLNIFRLYQLTFASQPTCSELAMPLNRHRDLRIGGTGVRVRNVEPAGGDCWTVTLDVKAQRIHRIVQLSVEVAEISAMDVLPSANTIVASPQHSLLATPG
jgi:hypothetical protein